MGIDKTKIEPALGAQKDIARLRGNINAPRNIDIEIIAQNHLNEGHIDNGAQIHPDIALGNHTRNEFFDCDGIAGNRRDFERRFRCIVIGRAAQFIGAKLARALADIGDDETIAHHKGDRIPGFHRNCAGFRTRSCEIRRNNRLAPGKGAQRDGNVLLGNQPGVEHFDIEACGCAACQNPERSAFGIEIERSAQLRI